MEPAYCERCKKKTDTGTWLAYYLKLRKYICNHCVAEIYPTNY